MVGGLEPTTFMCKHHDLIRFTAPGIFRKGKILITALLVDGQNYACQQRRFGHIIPIKIKIVPPFSLSVVLAHLHSANLVREKLKPLARS